MNLAGVISGAWRSREERVEAQQVERPVQLWEPDGAEVWTPEGTAQLMIANGADAKEVAEFMRKVKG